jgi:pimeloyl-ACP methyl ester carboxylesterase
MAVEEAYGLRYERTGEGKPLLLIHGTGSSRAAWRPVASLLAREYELLIVDLPGHGESEPPSPKTHPTPIGYAPLLGHLLDALGMGRVHTAGFSIGGWTSLELAKLRRARSVIAFGPAGLWVPRSPRSSEMSLWLSNRAARLARPLLPYLFATSVGRTVFLSQQFGRPWRLTADEAVAAAGTLAATRSFDQHLAATNRARFTGGRDIDVPVTIAFGARERLLSRRGARRAEELPMHARWVELPGCGHVPTWDDPMLVARVIRETARS